QPGAEFRDADTHLARQRPTGGVVRLLRRAFGVLAQIGVSLGLEQVAYELRKFLIHRDDPRALGIRGAVDRRVAREIAYPNAEIGHPTQQVRGSNRITLRLWDDVRVWRLLLVLLDRVASR